MVKKEDLSEWFKHLRPRKRLDYLCGLLHMCHPLELRFIGTVLEELARKDFHLLRDAEIKANQRNDISNNPTNNIDDAHLRNKISIALALMTSTNSSCADVIFRILESQVDGLLQLVRNKDIADQISLILTMAVYHPAFKFYQRTQLGEILEIILKRIKDLFGEDEETATIHVSPCVRQETSSRSESFSQAAASPEKVTIKCIKVVSTRDDQSKKNNFKSRDESLRRRGMPEYEIHTTWTNGEVTQIFMKYKQLQELHHKILIAFPEEKEKKQRLIPVFPGNHSHRSESLDAQIDSLNSYLSQLMKAPTHVLECEILHTALRNGPVVHRPPPPPPPPATVQVSPASPQAGFGPLASPIHEDNHPYAIPTLPRGPAVCDSSAALTNSVCSSHLSSCATSPTNSRTSSPVPVAVKAPATGGGGGHTSPNIELSLNQLLCLLNLENYSSNLSEFSFKQILSMSLEDYSKAGLPMDAQLKLKKMLDQLQLAPPPGRNGIMSKPPGLPPLHEAGAPPPPPPYFSYVQLQTYAPQFPPSQPPGLMPYHLAASLMAGAINTSCSSSVVQPSIQAPPPPPPQSELLASPDLPNSEASSPPASPRSGITQETQLQQVHPGTSGGGSSNSSSADSGLPTGPLPLLSPADTMTSVDGKKVKVKPEDSGGVEDGDPHPGYPADSGTSSKVGVATQPAVQGIGLTDEPVMMLSGTPPPAPLANGYSVDPPVAPAPLLGRPMSYTLPRGLPAGFKLLAQPTHTSALHNIVKMPCLDPKPPLHHSYLPPPLPPHHQANGNNNNSGGMMATSLTQPPPPQDSYQHYPLVFAASHQPRTIITSQASSGQDQQVYLMGADTNNPPTDSAHNQGENQRRSPPAAKSQSSSSTPSPPLLAGPKTSGVLTAVTSSGTEAGHMAPLRTGGGPQPVMPYYNVILVPPQNGLIQQPFYTAPPHHTHQPPPPTFATNGLAHAPSHGPPNHEHFLRSLAGAAPQFANAGGAAPVPPNFYGNSIYHHHHPNPHHQHQHQQHHHNHNNGGNNRNSGSPAGGHHGNHGKSACYNCGLPGHLAADCKESTMDNMSNNFRLNFEPKQDPQ